MSFSPVVIAEVSAVRHGIPRCGVHCEQGTLIGTAATYTESQDPLLWSVRQGSPPTVESCLWRVENGELVPDTTPSWPATNVVLALTWWENALWILTREPSNDFSSIVVLWRRETGRSWEKVWHKDEPELMGANAFLPWQFYPTDQGLFFSSPYRASDIAADVCGTWLYRGTVQRVDHANLWIGEFDGLLYACTEPEPTGRTAWWSGPGNVIWCSARPFGYTPMGKPFLWRGRPVMLFGRDTGQQHWLSLWQIDGPAAALLWEIELPIPAEVRDVFTHTRPYSGGLLIVCTAGYIENLSEQMCQIVWSENKLTIYRSPQLVRESWPTQYGWEAFSIVAYETSSWWWSSSRGDIFLFGEWGRYFDYDIIHNIIRQPWCTSVGALRFQWHTDRRWDDKASVGAFRFGWSDGSGGHKASVGGFRFGWSDGTGIGTATVGAFRFGWEATGNKDGAKALVNRFRFEWANACTPPDEGEHWFFVVHDGSQCDGVLVALSGDSANDCRCIVRAGDDTISPTDWTTYENCPVGCKHYLQRPGAIVRLAVIAPESVIEPPDVQITLLEE